MKFVCTVCGYVYEGDAAPAECPVCHVGADKFKKVEGDLTLAAEHEYGVYHEDMFIGTCSEPTEKAGTAVAVKYYAQCHRQYAYA